MHPSSETRPARRHRRSRSAVVVALVAVLALLAAACGSDDDSSGGSGGSVPPGPEISIGAQDFPESLILSEVYAQAFQAAGYDASVQKLGGYRDILFGAFESGDVNFTLEYAASMLNFLDSSKPAGSDAGENVEKAEPLLADKDLAIAEASDAVDTNVFVMTKEKSEELGITSLSDLAEKGADLKLGGPSDCPTNAFCIQWLEREYGVDLSGSFVALGTGRAQALQEDEFDVAVLFSTDPETTQDEFVVLKADDTPLPADNIVPVMTQALVDAYGDDFVDLVNKISKALTTANVAEMNRAYVVDKEDVADIAKAFLEEHDLT
jgi:osmoprotectant transport system substrate-binding protein